MAQSLIYPHSGSALKKIYIQLTVNDLINTHSDSGRPLTLWVQTGAFNRKEAFNREKCLLL